MSMGKKIIDEYTDLLIPSWKKWKLRHPERNRITTTNSRRKRRKELRKEIFALLGNKCSNPHCLVPEGCKDIRCLQIDHVNGGGAKEYRRFREDSNLYRFILRQIRSGSKDYQLLCANCNWIKRIENNEDKHALQEW